MWSNKFEEGIEKFKRALNLLDNKRKWIDEANNLLVKVK